jgi:hypothetical protein
MPRQVGVLVAQKAIEAYPEAIQVHDDSGYWPISSYRLLEGVGRVIFRGTRGQLLFPAVCFRLGEKLHVRSRSLTK